MAGLSDEYYMTCKYVPIAFQKLFTSFETFLKTIDNYDIKKWFCFSSVKSQITFKTAWGRVPAELSHELTDNEVDNKCDYSAIQ